MATFDINKVLEDATGSIQEAAVKELQDQVISAIKWNMSDQISKISQKFFTDEIQPVIASMLVDNKELIVKNVLAGFDDIGIAVANKMKEEALENLGRSYQFKKITEGLFR